MTPVDFTSILSHYGWAGILAFTLYWVIKMVWKDLKLQMNQDRIEHMQLIKSMVESHDKVIEVNHLRHMEERKEWRDNVNILFEQSEKRSAAVTATVNETNSLVRSVQTLIESIERRS